MKPRRTPRSNNVFRLSGGTEDNDLWIELCQDTEENPVLTSVWEFTDEERTAIINGANVQLSVWGNGHPPVAMSVTTERLGRGDDYPK